MKPSELIREARNELFERGWHQGAMYGPNEEVCALGAVDAALKANPSWLLAGEDEIFCYHMAARFLWKALPVGFNGYHWPVSVWNDRTGRTFSEVVDLFDKAEKLAEADE